MISHVIEVKVLYPRPSAPSVRAKLERLRNQIERDDGENFGVRRVGLVHAIWTSSYTAESHGDFFSRASGALRAAFPTDRFATQHGYTFERWVEGSNARLGGRSFKVHAGAAYVTLRA